jgi:hypothetical protein
LVRNSEDNDMTENYITGIRQGRAKTDYVALAAYAVESHAEAALRSGEPESDAQSTWAALLQTTEMMERYRAALHHILLTPSGTGAATVMRAAAACALDE